MSSTPQSYGLDDQIERLVQECWDERKIPILLSQLGGSADGEVGRRAKQQAGSLRVYLQDRLADRVRVIQHSDNPTVVGAVPVGAEVHDDNFDELLDRTWTKSEKTTFHFHPSLWAAFRKPLDPTRRRYMNVQPPLHFRDVPLESRSIDGTEIERECIVGPDVEAVVVQQKIKDWLRENDLESSSVFYRRDKTRTTHLPSDDLLGRLLLALEPEDLRRMSIPLDIVSKLRRQSL